MWLPGGHWLTTIFCLSSLLAWPLAVAKGPVQGQIHDRAREERGSQALGFT